MKSFFRFLLLALVLLIVAMISAVTAMRFAIHGSVVTVPKLVGLSPAEAERAAVPLGLTVMVERQYYSPSIPESRIMSQWPAPGTVVRRGWQVRVAQSLGPQRVAIPDVLNESVRAAGLNIRRRGLDVGAIAYLPILGVNSGQVLAQSPPPNAGFVSVPRISLLVSAPAPAQAYLMPNFAGQPLGSVNQALLDAGFHVGNVTLAPPDVANPPAIPPQPNPASIVVSQNPAAGEMVLGGATLNFEVR
ncbi:MAG TPA: PASTA domain-containing protein [Terriglobales bacterium]|nr:PASTA domain-containing protein [Terriglobales bacterium]